MERPEKSAAEIWRSYRDWFLVAAMLVGWGVIYGQLTTRLANDEAQIAAQRAYIAESLVPRSEQRTSDADLQERLKTMQQSLDQIQNEIFEMQQKAH
jgi:hypothetical protein